MKARRGREVYERRPCIEMAIEIEIGLEERGRELQARGRIRRQGQGQSSLVGLGRAACVRADQISWRMIMTRSFESGRVTISDGRLGLVRLLDWIAKRYGARTWT